MIRRLMLGAFISLFAAAPALAAGQQSATAHPRQLASRVHRLNTRIRRGVKRNQLTKADADKLRADEARIRAERRTFRQSAQGLTKTDRKNLDRQLRQANREVTRLRRHRGKGTGGA